MECEGFEKDDIELNGNLILDNKFCNDQNNNLSDGYSNVKILFPLIVFLLRCVCWLASLSVVIISNRLICTCIQLNWEDASTSVFNKFSSKELTIHSIYIGRCLHYVFSGTIKYLYFLPKAQ